MQLRRVAQCSVGVLWFAGVLGAGAGCSALGAAQQGISDTTSNIKAGEAATKQGIQDSKDHAKMLKSAGGGSGGAGGAGGAGDGSGEQGDPDGTRLTAAPTPANVPINDEIGAAKGDPVDWKLLQLQGSSGFATFQVNWDDPNADLSIDVYNEDGVNIATSPRRTGQQTGKKVLVKIDNPGLVYVKLAALQGNTVYTFKCKWGGPSVVPPPVALGGKGAAPGAPTQATASPPPAAAPPPPPPAPVAAAQVPNPAAPQQVPNPAPPPAAAAPGAPPVAAAAPGTAAAPGAAPGAPAGAAAAAPSGNTMVNGVEVPKENDPNHPRGKVLQTYRDESGALLLFIDRGSASGLKLGMKGHVFQGDKGDGILDGSEFKIAKVVDATHSIGRMPKDGRQTLGAKNNRCIIHILPWP